MEIMTNGLRHTNKQIKLLFQKEIKQNREYIKRMENKSIRFYYWKMEVDIYAEHKSIRND